MQKKIIALAVAGLASTAAFAQTNVQIYGVADAAYVYTNVNGGNTLNGPNNAAATREAHGRDTSLIQSGQLAGSRIGFKGTEDLGNGLKAIFTLEYSLDLDVNTTIGAGATGVRQSFVGLSSKAGDLTLGRQYAPGYYTVAMDPTVASPALSSVDQAQAFAGSTIRATGAARWNNSVNFKSANMAGFTAQVIYSAGENANELALGESYGIGADYAVGPVAVKYVYHRAALATPAVMSTTVFNTVTTAAFTGAQDEHYLGASFDAKVVKLMGSVQTVDQGNRGYANGRAAESTVYQFGAIVPVGKGNIHASYAYADRNVSSNNPGVIAGPANRGDISSVNVAYTHGLSKRTTLYTGLRYTDTDTINGGNVVTAFGAGVNHAF